MGGADDFGDVKTSSGLAKLNDYMSKKSYVVGCCPTQEDLRLFAQMSGSPSASEFPHAERWYRHIKSFTASERAKFPGQKAGGAPAKKEDKKEEADDDFDVFGEETAGETASREAMKAAAPKKDEKKKKAVINKSTLVLEIKPQSLEINLDEVEKAVRQIKMEGLDWSSASKKVPVAYGLHKLQMGCVIVDDLVATDDIIEKIECIGLTPEQVEKYHKTRDTGGGDDDEEEEEAGWVQSAQIVSFQKL